MSLYVECVQRRANTQAPKNLIPLLLFRPLRLCVPSEQMRSARIVLLKITHAPCIASIWLYEKVAEQLRGRSMGWPYLSPAQKGKPTTHIKGRPRRSQLLGGRKGTKTFVPKTPTTPINIAGRSSSAGATRVNTPLSSLHDALDAMEQKFEHLTKQLETSARSREDLSTQVEKNGEKLEELRSVARTNETKMNQLLAKVEKLTGEEQRNLP